MPKLDIKEKEYRGNIYQYFSVGKGKDIVILHGMGASKEVMKELVENLPNKFRCTFLDLPGHQDLDCKKFTSLKSFENYVSIFLEYLNLETFALLGFSFGGNIALSVSNKYISLGKNIPCIL